MAGSSRHTADLNESEDTCLRLLVCLAVSGAMHLLLMLLTWSSLSVFDLTGTAAHRRSSVSSVSLTSRLDAVIRPQKVPDPAADSAEPVPSTDQGAIVEVPASVTANLGVPTIPHASSLLPKTEPARSVEQSSATAEPVRSAPLPQYFRSEELTRQPELVGNLDDALREPLEVGFRGRLVIKLFLDEKGKVDSVRVVESTMPVRIEGLVVKAFYFARYRPGEIEDQAVMSEMTVEVGVSSNDVQVPSRAVNAAPAESRPQ